MYKKVRMLFSLTIVIMLIACNAKENDSIDNVHATEIQTVESAEILVELPTDGLTAEPTVTKTEKFPITVDWIETKEEYEAARYKSNGKMEVSISRVSKSIMNEEGEVLANIYYDKPVVSGDSEVSRKINYFFEKEEQEWFDGGGRNTLYNDDNYIIFYDQFCNMFEMFGEGSMVNQPPCYTISTRIMFFDSDILSVVQVAHFFTGHNYHYYYGSTFDMESGELIPIDKLIPMDADRFKLIIEDILPEDEIYDEVGEDNYVIHYYDDEIAMNYEYFYDGKSFYIILNRNRELEDGLIIEWNGKWGDDYEAESFQYWEQLGSEMLQKEK